jgi:hypothetical protein
MNPIVRKPNYFEPIDSHMNSATIDFDDFALQSFGIIINYSEQLGFRFAYLVFCFKHCFLACTAQRYMVFYLIIQLRFGIHLCCAHVRLPWLQQLTGFVD